MSNDYRKISSFRQCRMWLQHCCRFWLQCCLRDRDGRNVWVGVVCGIELFQLCVHRSRPRSTVGGWSNDDHGVGVEWCLSRPVCDSAAVHNHAVLHDVRHRRHADAPSNGHHQVRRTTALAFWVDLIKWVSNVRPSSVRGLAGPRRPVARRTGRRLEIFWLTYLFTYLRPYVRPSTKCFFDFNEI